MIIELGHFALILSLCFSLALAIFPILGVQRGSDRLMLSGRALALGQFVFTALATLSLVYAFLSDDFRSILWPRNPILCCR